MIGRENNVGISRLRFGIANSSRRHKSVTGEEDEEEKKASFQGVDFIKLRALGGSTENLIANIKLQTQKLWHVMYSMYLARLAAVTLVS